MDNRANSKHLCIGKGWQLFGNPTADIKRPEQQQKNIPRPSTANRFNRFEKSAMKAFVFAFLVVAAAAVADSKCRCRPQPVGECPQVNGVNSTYLMDLNDRGVFYECNAGVPYQQKCPAGLVFNPNLMVCDYPCYDCQPSGPVGNCDGVPKFFLRYLRDASNVAVFYVCNVGKAVRYDCPEGKVYNTQFKVCFNAV